MITVVIFLSMSVVEAVEPYDKHHKPNLRSSFEASRQITKLDVILLTVPILIHAIHVNLYYILYRISKSDAAGDMGSPG